MPRVQFPAVPKKISAEKIDNVAEINRWPSFEESGQWLENVDPTLLVLVSGKLVLQKKFYTTPT